MFIFISGGSLDKYGQIPEAILGRMSVSVVDGLQYLWSLKIMHRGKGKQEQYIFPSFQSTHHITY